MSQATTQIRPIQRVGDVWQVGLSDGGWGDVLFGDGSPATLMPGWRAHSCLELDGGSRLLLLHHEGGPTAMWVLDADLRFVSDVAGFTEAAAPEVHRAVSREATAFVRDLRREPLRPAADPAWAVLRTMGEGTLAAFAALSAFSTTIRSLDGAAPIELTAARGPARVSIDALREVLTIPGPDPDPRSHPWLKPAARAGRLEVPALSQPGAADAVFLVARWNSHPTYLCTENTLGLRYYLIQRPEVPTLVYFPDDDLLVSLEPLADPDGTAHLILGRLDFHLAALAISPIESVPERTTGLGLFSLGILNFGHAMWDEMHAADVFLSELAPMERPPRLYMVLGASGLDLYGPVEELYPEFAGGVVRERTEVAVMAGAIREGVALVLRAGQGALHASRDRIARVVQRHAEENGLPARYEALRGKKGREKLVITLGLRLSNRCPVDPLGFYIRLTQALQRRFGPLVIVIDGINGGDDPSKAAAYVFNGLKRVGADFVESLRDGSAELRKELNWVDAFTFAVESKGVTVINCVGRPIRENLFWLSKSDFFVAPFGGGVAKLRWALDIPGFILVSRTNLEYCVLLNVYNDEKFMDGPFTPLYFNRVEDVTDMPLDPPRAEPPVIHGIPQPEDFLVGESAVIPRICDLVATHTGRENGPSERGGLAGVWTKLRRSISPAPAGPTA